MVRQSSYEDFHRKSLEGLRATIDKLETVTTTGEIKGMLEILQFQVKLCIQRVDRMHETVKNFMLYGIKEQISRLKKKD